MAKRHGAREQQRQAKQKAKRDEKRRQLARQTSPNPVIRLQAADRWPITACLIHEGDAAFYLLEEKKSCVR